MVKPGIKHPGSVKRKDLIECKMKTTEYFSLTIYSRAKASPQNIQFYDLKY
jgi:hypothetical protein